MPRHQPIVPLEPGEIVINPATGLPEEDDTAKLAIKNGFYYVTKKGRGVIEWGRMRTAYKYDYTAIPENYGFTEQQAQIMMKLAHEKFVPLVFIARQWDKPYKWAIQFVQAKKIPVFKEPIPPYGYVCFSGDIVRALETCMLDFEKDGQFWPRYILREHEMERRRKANAKKRANEARANQPHEVDQRSGPPVEEHAQVLAGAKG
jgi:hypothetical protein